MNLSMTKIYKFQGDISTEALKELEKHSKLLSNNKDLNLAFRLSFPPLISTLLLFFFNFNH